jgi:hypothetical protein
MRYMANRLEDLIAGLVTGGIGLFILIESRSYSTGTLTNMGPGYFPMILGGIMILLALIMILGARTSESPVSVESGQLRGMAFLAAAFLAFAFTIESLGLMVAVTAAVFLAALANRRTPLLTALILAVATAVVSALLFRVGLGLQIKAF